MDLFLEKYIIIVEFVKTALGYVMESRIINKGGLHIMNTKPFKETKLICGDCKIRQLPDMQESGRGL